MMKEIVLVLVVVASNLYGYHMDYLPPEIPSKKYLLVELQDSDENVLPPRPIIVSNDDSTESLETLSKNLK